MSSDAASAAPTLAPAVVADIERALAVLPVEALEREYWEQDEFLFIPDALPGETVARLLEDVERLEPGLNRSYVPRHRKQR